MELRRIPVKRISQFIYDTCIAAGINADHARIIMEQMTESDLQEIHSHGIIRLPMYIKRVKAGGYNLNPNIRLINETPVSAIVDGDNGFGQVVVRTAVETAIAKAEKCGMAWVGTRNSNHAGAGGSYAIRAIPHDMIGIYMAVGNANHMPPWGGIDKMLSTNPLTIAIPTKKEYPILLDMATTNASFGKIKVYAQQGKPLPVGWMIDKHGNPLTDASKYEEGILVPIGDYKGYGLNFVIGALAGVLNGAAFAKTTIDFNHDHKTPTNSGQAFMAMRVDLFQDVEKFKEAMDEKVREMKSVTPIDPKNPVLLPGEIGFRDRPMIQEKGIPVSDILLAQLREVAEMYNLEERFPEY